MKKENKNLLLRYLSMALPYGVVIKITLDGGMLEASYNMKWDADLLADLIHIEDDFKPYPRPLARCSGKGGYCSYAVHYQRVIQRKKLYS